MYNKIKIEFVMTVLSNIMIYQKIYVRQIKMLLVPIFCNSINKTELTLFDSHINKQLFKILTKRLPKYQLFHISIYKVFIYSNS